ncbi:hypothetical protein WCN79_20730 [Xanthomonas axonopodis pv. vasculorum]|uniref:Uncharacterized protein n=1 Tax=Xanthomonas axonopodis pv. vasculorum TaxID=325777 RepID=A0A098Q5Z8_9XANT|nr:hypothetical protein [Xanthomonas axonopodis]KGE53382.1 hypothetical protein GW15_0202720 [Xanthomonas axonopodis pv. vasculorum]PPV09581.1 hypothetical protein XavaCFBP5823_13830 [Xanthomonas axonopodis pv. vasculorum]QKD88432.1 hypothetical protein XAV_02585 [Xanthomonas axonopodis pv. vasculorum]
MAHAAAHGIAGSVDRVDPGIGKQMAAAAFGRPDAASLFRRSRIAIAAHQLPGAPRGNGFDRCHPRVIRSTQAGRIFLGW